MQSSRTAKEFVIASDGLRQEVVRLQEIPWPWPSATYPAMLLTADCRMRGAYSVMPQVKYECDGKKACFNHGAEVEASYRALLSELRIYAQQQGQRAPARCSHSGHSPRPEAHPLPQFCLSSAGPIDAAVALWRQPKYHAALRLLTTQAQKQAFVMSYGKGLPYTFASLPDLISFGPSTL